MTSETQTSQSERFETAFNRLHKSLMHNVKNARSDKFTDLVYKGKSHALIRFYEHDLCQFAKLRNAIVHEKIEEGYYIAEPHIDIVEKIESMADEFEKPQSALSIATKPVYYFYEDDKLSEVLVLIRKHSHSRFPVYDSNDCYLWLLTSAEIVKWMADHFSETSLDLNSIKIKDIHSKRFRHHVEFTSQNSTVLDVEDIFEEYQRRNQKLEAVLITKNGKPSEKPNGIITTLDLLEAEISE
ncbi:CBS domain-containing protein [Bacillus sp. MUM 13]|uniref:CBS domain-containing protein n=1 Tax=Bacillus sp. MUM 13 TaxID=1678001 RepID=UPI0008F59CAD|nr:CBS domain-containing protein [Bacillus sp. MUM 13]OIK09656.1 hypothetical protein BIV59_16520 [Bacillus sp. MUM 13]